MPTITIPRNIKANEELVAIPRKKYEDFLRMQKIAGQDVSSVKRTIKTPKKYENFYNQLDKDLSEALQDVKEGRTSGPFNTAEEAIRFLRRKR